MVPFFAEKINNILKDKKGDFKKFYVDTAILGNSKALELAIDYYGTEHVAHCTDTPFGITPSGTTKEIEETINSLSISEENKAKIFHNNIIKCKPAQSLKPGDVVSIPANVKHWHGTKKDSWFSHIAIEVPGEKISNEWCEPVSDEDCLTL